MSLIPHVARIPAKLALAVAAALACATIEAAEPSAVAVEAPQLRVGDKWTYRIVEGYRQKQTWIETQEVTAADAGAITIAVTIDGPRGTITREDVLSAPGVVRRGAIVETKSQDFDPALIRFRFPLTSGAKWSQRVRDVDKPPGPYGDISFKASVAGKEKVSTPAGQFDAVKIRYVYQLDDESLSNHPTQCEYVVWYAPAVGSVVREQRRSWSVSKGHSPMRTPGENAVFELTAFTRGG